MVNKDWIRGEDTRTGLTAINLRHVAVIWTERAQPGCESRLVVECMDTDSDGETVTRRLRLTEDLIAQLHDRGLA